MITHDPSLACQTTGIARAALASLTMSSARERAAPTRAGAAPRAWRLGSLTLVERPGDGLVPDDAPLRLRRDGDWIIETRTLPPECGTVEGRMIRLAPVPNPQTAGPDLRVAEPPIRGGIALIVPDAWRPELSAALARRDDGPLAGPAAELLALLLRDTPARLARMDIREEAAVADVIAALIRASLSRGSVDACAPGLAQPARARVSRVIRENIGSARLDARRICALTGISRSTLYRLFEGESGVAGHVRAIRLGLVMDDLLDPALRDEPISAIAERRGFHCAASFNRTFRRAYGRTPSEARAAALSQGVAGAMRAAE